MKKKKQIAVEQLDDIDVFFDPKPLTTEDSLFLSAFIRKMKKTAEKKSTGKKRKQAA